MRQFTLIIISTGLSFILCSCKVQKTDKSIMNVESISYYSEVNITGLTTAKASSFFKSLEDDNATTKIFTNAPLNLLTEAFNKSEKKRHIQKKLGTKMIFTLILIDGSIHKSLISKDVIIDFTTYTEHWIRDEEHKKKMEVFISELRAQMEQ